MGNPKPLDGNTVYVSPTGLLSNTGRADSPVIWEYAKDLLSRTQNNVSVFFQDGIYSYNSIDFGVTGKAHGYYAQSGHRPIFTGTDGYPPSVVINPNTTIDGLWFGGTKYTTNTGARSVNFATGGTSVMSNCTFWGYAQCVGGDVGNNNLLSRNRFVNCGLEGLYHDIYVTSNGIDLAHSSVIKEGVHIGGGGYKIQIYHDPVWITAHANFLSNNGGQGLAVQNNSHIITNNIMWDAGTEYFNANNCVFSKNVIGPDHAVFSAPEVSNTVIGNVFCNGDLWGDTPVSWSSANITENLGKSKIEIDSAISALLNKFTQTTAQILDDMEISENLNILHTIIDAWKSA